MSTSSPLSECGYEFAKASASPGGSDERSQRKLGQRFYPSKARIAQVDVNPAHFGRAIRPGSSHLGSQSMSWFQPLLGTRNLAIQINFSTS
jgi:hypothetical protein